MSVLRCFARETHLVIPLLLSFFRRCGCGYFYWKTPSSPPHLNGLNEIGVQFFRFRLSFSSLPFRCFVVSLFSFSLPLTRIASMTSVPSLSYERDEGSYREGHSPREPSLSESKFLIDQFAGHTVDWNVLSDKFEDLFLTLSSPLVDIISEVERSRVRKNAELGLVRISSSPFFPPHCSCVIRIYICRFFFLIFVLLFPSMRLSSLLKQKSIVC